MKQSKTKILIAGIGGVGGFFGGLLARKYEDSTEVEIYFLARGEHLEAIKKNGLEVRSGTDIFNAKPKMATDNASEIGEVDFILIATKGYDLDGIVDQISACVGPETTIIPLLNGVSNREQIKAKLPNAQVLDGCVYMIARYLKPGIITNSGALQSLYFGLQDEYDSRLKSFEAILKEAGADAHYEKNILKVIWEKYVFLSAAAGVTAYYDLNIGEIHENEEKLSDFKSMALEVINLARKKGAELSDDIVEKTLANFMKMPREATTSMHSDFRKNKQKTELESLIGYVAREGENLGVSTPIFTKVYKSLKASASAK